MENLVLTKLINTNFGMFWQIMDDLQEEALNKNFEYGFYFNRNEILENFIKNINFQSIENI